MSIKAGDKVPAATLKVMTPDGPANATTAELFGTGKVVMFSVPGAFTPTCSARHLPGFVDHAADLAAKGVDRIVWDPERRRAADACHGPSLDGQP